MKIGQPSDNNASINTNVQAALPKSSQSASASATATAAKSTQSAGVAVTVSSLARTLESTKSGEQAVFNSAKVDEMRAAIQQGTFVVNPEAIADKLLANAQEMLGRTKI